MSEYIQYLIAMLISWSMGYLFCDVQHKRRDERIEEGIKDLHRHRDSLIGRDEDEA